MSDYTSKHPAVIAIAADLCGWKKSVNIKEDGSLDWYGESGHPTDSEIDAKLSAAQTDYDANGPLGHPDRG